MKQLIVSAAAATAMALLYGAPARAQANTTFVSGHRLDANPCTVSAPCRSFARAVLVTNPGGTLRTFGDNYIIDTSNSGSLIPISLE